MPRALKRSGYAGGQKILSMAAIKPIATTEEIEAFNVLRARLFEGMTDRLSADVGFKYGDGQFSVGRQTIEAGQRWRIRLECYALGPSRRYDWDGETLGEVTSVADQDVKRWIVAANRTDGEDLGAKPVHRFTPRPLDPQEFVTFTDFVERLHKVGEMNSIDFTVDPFWRLPDYLRCMVFDRDGEADRGARSPISTQISIKAQDIGNIQDKRLTAHDLVYDGEEHWSRSTMAETVQAVASDLSVRIERKQESHLRAQSLKRQERR
jgi:hypothetical protein